MLFCGDATSNAINKEGVLSIMNTKKLDLTVMSFNIRVLTSSDTGDRSWSVRKQPVSNFISGNDASIVCMQEVLGTQYTDLKAMLSDRYDIVWYGRNSVEDSKGEGLAIAYDKSEWELVSKDRFWLSETPDTPSFGWGAKYLRICVATVLEHRATKARISVFNVHLDNWSEEARTCGIQLVLNKISVSEYPSYLCGDFNATREKEAYILASKVMNDSQLVSLVTDFGHTFNAWGTNQDEKRVIDYCLFSKQHFDIISFKICKDKWGENNDKYLSDHNPIISKVKMLYI